MSNYAVTEDIEFMADLACDKIRAAKTIEEKTRIALRDINDLTKYVSGVQNGFNSWSELNEAKEWVIVCDVFMENVKRIAVTALKE